MLFHLLWFSELDQNGLLGQDALTYDWPSKRLYAIPVVLDRILKESPVCSLVVAVSAVISAHDDILQGPPWELLRQKDLLSQHHCPKFSSC